MTMIERVARAMWAGGDYDDTWDEHTKNEGTRFQARWFKMARAAIDAMYLPTLSMLGAQNTATSPEARTIWGYMVIQAKNELPENYPLTRREKLP